MIWPLFVTCVCLIIIIRFPQKEQMQTINGFFRAEESGFCQDFFESELILKLYFQPTLVPHLRRCQFGGSNSLVNVDTSPFTPLLIIHLTHEKDIKNQTQIHINVAACSQQWSK